MKFMSRVKSLTKAFKREVAIYRLVLKDARTPVIAKIILALAIGYVFMPFDLIPDWIPVLGLLDDLIIVPGLVWLALRFTPKEIVAECRNKIQKEE